MREQERKFPLAEVHTTIGAQGQIIVDQSFMELLGVQPGDWIAFCIDEQGLVTVKGERKGTQESGTGAPTGEATSIPHPDQVTQTTLFSTEGEA
jgi:bifunctional DNA-binding transcriptional regulator/antitoxin component of YhaV-PrlF toxin-antitoxin module